MLQNIAYSNNNNIIEFHTHCIEITEKVNSQQCNEDWVNTEATVTQDQLPLEASFCEKPSFNFTNRLAIIAVKQKIYLKCIHYPNTRVGKRFNSGRKYLGGQMGNRHHQISFTLFLEKKKKPTENPTSGGRKAKIIT